MKALLILLVLAILYANGYNMLAASSEPSKAAEKIIQNYTSLSQLPVIQIIGEYESYASSSDSDGKLTLRTRAEINGHLDLAAGHLSILFPVYESQVLLPDGKIDYTKNTRQVAYDGAKWVEINYRTQDEIAAGDEGTSHIKSFVGVRNTHPDAFLSTLDPTFAPMFVSLLKIHKTGANTASFFEAIQDYPYKTGVCNDTGNIIIRFISECTSDELHFSQEKNYALTARLTDFSLCHKQRETALKNEMHIKEYKKINEIYFPTKGEFTQHVGKRVTVRRIFNIKEIKIVERDDTLFTLAIPAGALVKDERTGLTFTTSDKLSE